MQPPTIATPGLSDTITDSRIAFKLMRVYYHDNTNFYSRNMYACLSTMYDTYGQYKDSEINVFFYLNPSYPNGGGCGYPNYVNMHNVPKDTISLWANTQLLAHELGHSLGLQHTWSDSFDDTYYPDNNTSWADCNNTTISNNIMGYNTCRNYLSPKQIGYIHWGLLNNPNRMNFITGL